jgi:hypothetical protein
VNLREGGTAHTYAGGCYQARDERASPYYCAGGLVRNRRDGRVATFRPIPQSVSGVGVRFSIGYKIRNLGEKSFCLTRPERKFFIPLRCCNHFSFFILTKLGVGRIVGNVVAFLWRGAWGGFGGLAWHPPIALTRWGLVECEIPTP